MKKLLFAMALIGVLIGSTLGGIALADKPESAPPFDALDEINQKVTDIEAKLANVTHMESYEGEFEVEAGYDDIILAESYPEVRHVTLTLAVGGTYGPDAYDMVGVTNFLGPTGWRQVRIEGERGYVNVEFDATRWRIWAMNGESPEDHPWDVYYMYTVTYPK